MRIVALTITRNINLYISKIHIYNRNIMEIRIVITKKNKEKVLKLIDQLVECEAEGIATESTDRTIFEPAEVSISSNFLRELPEVESIKVTEPKVEESRFGTWGMFNSYVPGKAALRVLTNLINKNGGRPVRFSDLVDECVIHFSRSGLCKYRGFPKKTSESARGRLATHLILPYHEMGLMRVYGEKKDLHVMITEEGLAFTKLPNPLLDEGDKTKFLSEEESKWLISHLRRIDKLGYKEFSILEDLTRFLASAEKRFEDIANWFKRNENFVDWLRTGSRYQHDSAAFSRQLDNVARTFASGKIALLRELGLISTSRATYHVVRGLKV